MLQSIGQPHHLPFSAQPVHIQRIRRRLLLMCQPGSRCSPRRSSSRCDAGWSRTSRTSPIGARWKRAAISRPSSSRNCLCATSGRSFGPCDSTHASHALRSDAAGLSQRMARFRVHEWQLLALSVGSLRCRSTSGVGGRPDSSGRRGNDVNDPEQKTWGRRDRGADCCSRSAILAFWPHQPFPLHDRRRPTEGTPPPLPALALCVSVPQASRGPGP